MNSGRTLEDYYKMPKSRVYVFVFCLLQLGVTTCLAADYGSRCRHHGQRGTCKKALECAPARESILKTRMHNLKRCGFDGLDEIVCCPAENGDTTTERGPESRFPTRASVRACNEYAKVIGNAPNIYILDGVDAEAGEFPHMVALGYKNGDDVTWDCGGALISKQYVLTAAHCIVKVDQNPPFKVRTGVLNINGDKDDIPQDYMIKNITVHPDFKWREKFNDIALLKLEKEVRTGKKVYPACLYLHDTINKSLVVSGWGATTNNGHQATILQKAILQYVDLESCNNTFYPRSQKPLITSQLCAHDNTSDTCQGDSGGPLQVQSTKDSSIYSIVGVTSYGLACGGKYPGIYTKVFSYLEWIESIVWGRL